MKDIKTQNLAIKTTSEIWLSMRNVRSSVGDKNKSDLVLNEIYGICEKKSYKKQLNEYKMTKKRNL